jgi:L-cysteine/cystine lyase
MPFDVRAIRDELPSVRANVYLNAGTFGPLPRVAAEAMHTHVGRSFERGRIGHAGIVAWLEQMTAARDAFARTLAVPSEDVALAHATTDGCNTVVWGLGLSEGDEVVTTTHEHPGLTAPLDELARVRGVIVRTVEPELSAIVEAVGPRTRLVALSHVLWTTGHTLPLASIAGEIRATWGETPFLLADGAQSVGAIDVAPPTLGFDAYTVSGQKWLCGPSGTGALWVRRGALERLGTPWPWYLSKDRSPRGLRDWPDARRLDASTIGMTSLAGAIASLPWQHRAWNMGGREHAQAMAGLLRERLASTRGVRLIPAASPSQLVSFVVEGEDASALVRRLEAGGVLVRSIPGLECTRAAVGFWNDEGDIDRLVERLQAPPR